MTVLADTSIWIDFFRDREPAAGTLDRLLGEREVCVCGPIVAELLAGVPASEQEALWLALGSLPVVELGMHAWRKSGELAQALRRAGAGVPLLDLLIGVAAVQADAQLWTRDRDFERVRAVLPELELYAA